MEDGSKALGLAVLSRSRPSQRPSRTMSPAVAMLPTHLLLTRRVSSSSSSTAPSSSVSLPPRRLRPLPPAPPPAARRLLVLGCLQDERGRQFAGVVGPSQCSPHRCCLLAAWAQAHASPQHALSTLRSCHRQPRRGGHTLPLAGPVLGAELLRVQRLHGLLDLYGGRAGAAASSSSCSWHAALSRHAGLRTGGLSDRGPSARLRQSPPAASAGIAWQAAPHLSLGRWERHASAATPGPPLAPIPHAHQPGEHAAHGGGDRAWLPSLGLTLGWLRPKYSGPAMAVLGGGGSASPARRRASISALIRFRI